MPTTSLLIPIETQAWVVNDGVIRTRPVQRWQLDYNALSHFSSPELVSPDGTSPDTGAYIHWTLPASLRQATQEAKTNNMQFPAVPNRWLVVRYAAPDETKPRTAAAWVIESDYLPKANSDPAQQKGSTTYSHLNDQKELGQTLLGRCVPLGGWQETRATEPLFLTAVSNGDAHFSIYQPYNQNVFSFHDELKDIDKSLLSYCIMGWYSNSDLLQNKDESESLKQFLSSYQWNLPLVTPESVPERLICQSMVLGVDWNRKGDAPSNAIPQRNDGDSIKIAVGSSTAEALAAFVTANAPSIPPDLMSAFNAGLLHKFEDTMDGTEDIKQHAHQAGFSKQPGGISWTVVPKEKVQQPEGVASSDQASSTLALSKEQAAALDALNAKQGEYEREQHVLEKLQWDLYTAWWKKNRLATMDFPPDSSPSVDNLNQYCLDLYTSVKSQLNTVDGLKKSREDLKKTLIDQLTSNAVLKKRSRSPFMRPQDPVILVPGASAFKIASASSDLLNCRISNQTVTGIQIDNTSLSISDIFPYMPALDSKNIPAPLAETLQCLLTEFFLLDSANVKNLMPLLSSKGIKPEDLEALLKAQSPPAAFQGILPLYGLSSWSQPWSPLFLKWSVHWYPLPFPSSGTIFENGEYALKSIPSPAPSPYTLSGRNFVTRNASFAFKGELKRLLIQDPSFKQLIPEWQPKDWDQLINTIDNWDVVSLTLSGFHDQLAMRDDRMHRIPHSAISDEEKYASVIGEQSHRPPIPEAGVPFQPVRYGQFNFDTLFIIDRFGQSFNILQSDEAASYGPSISDTLLPNADDSKKLLTVSSSWPGRFVQLTPSLLQPSRLTIEWLGVDAPIKTPAIPCTSQENPIAGWLLPNYLDQGLQVYAPEGNYLGELRLNADSHCVWEAALSTTFPIYINPTAVSKDYPWLGSLLQTLTESTDNAFQALTDVIDDALSAKISPSAQYGHYLSALVGRPLALARTRFQLELHQTAYEDQSWTNTPPGSSSDPFKGYSFLVQLGKTDFNQDGLVGYFLEKSFKTFYSLYSAPMNNKYVDNQALFSLKPQNPGSAQYTYTTLLFDPFSPIHAYTDILPVHKIVLPAVFIKMALSQMAMTFRQGPLLTIRDLSNNSLPTATVNPVSIRLPKPSVKGDWSWVEAQSNEQDPPTLSWKELPIQVSDTVARFEPLPNQVIIVEGRLKLNHPFDKKLKSTLTVLSDNKGEEEKKNTVLPTITRSTLLSTSRTVSSYLKGTFATLPYEFEEHVIARDGDCGFTALGVSRKELVSLLLSRENSAADRAFLAPEIKEYFQSGGFAKTSIGSKLYAEWQVNSRSSTHDDAVRALNDCLAKDEPTANRKRLSAEELLLLLAKNTLPTYQKDLNILRASADLDKRIDAFCTTSATFSAYVVNGLGGTAWLGYRSARLFARERNYNLYLWRRIRQQGEITLMTNESQENVKPTNTFHLLHTDSYTHYNLLEIKTINGFSALPSHEKNKSSSSRLLPFLIKSATNAMQAGKFTKPSMLTYLHRRDIFSLAQVSHECRFLISPLLEDMRAKQQKKPAFALRR